MKYLSICSGIEAASVAFEPLGWRPLAFSEIEAFPRAVLKHHYPDTPCHGDFTTLKDETWIVDADMLCGGTPCQAFSVAGNRQSLADDRGNLTLQFVLLADAIDALRFGAGRDPAWILWENVPGVLSTNDNAFGAFLAGLAGEDVAFEPGPRPEQGRSSVHWTWKSRLGKHVPKWPVAGVVDGPHRVVAWRVLDAQHFGLAQRRQRVFVLARGGAGKWAAADALLPIIQGSEWHPAPSRGAGQGTARGFETGPSGGRLTDLAPTIDCLAKNGPIQNQLGVGVMEVIPEVTRPLTAAMGTKWNGNGDLESSLIPSIVGTLTANMVGCAGTPGYNETEHILPLLVRMREGKEGGGKGPLVSEDQSLCLATANDQVLAYNVHSANSCAMRGNGDSLAAIPTDIARAVDTAGFTANQGGTVALGSQMQVRRLTPVECARLQGFPDDYLSQVTFRGKCPPADGVMYKALGNSWAVPCARWIGERIKDIRP